MKSRNLRGVIQCCDRFKERSLFLSGGLFEQFCLFFYYAEFSTILLIVFFLKYDEL